MHSVVTASVFTLHNQHCQPSIKVAKLKQGLQLCAQLTLHRDQPPWRLKRHCGVNPPTTGSLAVYELAPLPPHTQCPSNSHRRAGCQIQPITFASNPCSSLLDEPDSSLLLVPKSWLLAGTDFSSLHCIYYWGVKHSLQIPSLLACYEEPAPPFNLLSLKDT